MEITHLKIIESAIVILLYFIAKSASNKIVDKTMALKEMPHLRAKVIKKGINVVLLLVTITIILVIWGVNQSDLATYIGSILTVVGVAFVAQWSILSNITASVIIFFNHSVKIDDTITIMEAKEYEVEGKVCNVGLFFITMITKEGKEITLPNTVFIQKMIKK